MTLFPLLLKQCAVKGAGLQRVQLPHGNWVASPLFPTALSDRREKRKIDRSK